MYSGHEVKTWLDNSVCKNKTEAKGGKNEARTEDGENKALSGGLVDKTRPANNVFKTEAKGGKTRPGQRTARTRHCLADSWTRPVSPTTASR